MRASLFLAAVAAVFVSLSTAMAEERAAGSAVRTPKAATVNPSVTVAAAQSENAGKASSSTDASPASTQPTVKSPAVQTPKKALPPTLVVKINLSTQSMALHYDGGRRETWKISSGRAGFATPRGVYRPQWASKMWYSRKYENAPMPHAVFFVGGVAVHGTYATGLLGTAASHGCVRLATGNAARFYALVHKHGYARTRIEVFGTPPVPRLANRRASERMREASMGGRGVPSQRMVSSGGSGFFGWSAPKPAAQLRRQPNGVIYLAPDSPYRGRDSFVYNGILYKRVR
ncbi:MAG: L,D-transpeptidase [Hyphomicrobiaceae bacterium]